MVDENLRVLEDHLQGPNQFVGAYIDDHLLIVK
jgi:hypothetical protein